MKELVQPKLYYFMANAHHYLISKIDDEWYWVFDLCTIRSTDERWNTLEEAIKNSEKYYKELHIFDTYRELFAYMLKQEIEFDFMDLFEDKNLVERESLHESKVELIHKKMWIK